VPGREGHFELLGQRSQRELAGRQGAVDQLQDPQPVLGGENYPGGRDDRPVQRALPTGSGAAVTLERLSTIRPAAISAIENTTIGPRPPPGCRASPKSATPIPQLTSGSATVMIGRDTLGKPAW